MDRRRFTLRKAKTKIQTRENISIGNIYVLSGFLIFFFFGILIWSEEDLHGEKLKFILRRRAAKDQEYSKTGQKTTQHMIQKRLYISSKALMLLKHPNYLLYNFQATSQCRERWIYSFSKCYRTSQKHIGKVPYETQLYGKFN